MYKSIVLGINWTGLVFFILSFAFASGDSMVLVASLVMIVIFAVNIRYINRRTINE